MTISNQASGIRTGVCTSTTRPVTPYEGQTIYETDTDKVLVYNGSNWYPNWNMPWGYLTHSTLAAGTAVNPFGGLSTLFSVTYLHVPNRRLRVSGNFSVTLSSATNTACRVQNTSTTICYLDLPSYNPPSYAYTAYTTSSGTTQTFTVQLLYGGTPATATIAASSLAQFLLEDIGPA